MNKSHNKIKANENLNVQKEKSEQVKVMDEYLHTVSEMLQYLKENKNSENKEVNSEKKYRMVVFRSVKKQLPVLVLVVIRIFLTVPCVWRLFIRSVDLEEISSQVAQNPSSISLRKGVCLL